MNIKVLHLKKSQRYNLLYSTHTRTAISISLPRYLAQSLDIHLREDRGRGTTQPEELHCLQVHLYNVFL